MDDKPTLEKLLGAQEAQRLRRLSECFGQAIDIMFGAKPMNFDIVEPLRCDTCGDFQPEPEATLSKCPYCGQQVCFTCADTARHSHDQAKEQIRFVFCLPCGQVQPIGKTRDGNPACSVCHFEWAPRAIRGAEIINRNEAICCWCGAHQTFPQIPFSCARCALILA